jgi:hypothetical protein
VNPNHELWEKSDFARIAATMRDSGEALVDGLGASFLLVNTKRSNP